MPFVCLLNDWLCCINVWCEQLIMPRRLWGYHQSRPTSHFVIAPMAKPGVVPQWQYATVIASVALTQPCRTLHAIITLHAKTAHQLVHTRKQVRFR